MLQDAMFPVTEVPAVGVPEKGKEIDATGYKFIVREDTGLSCASRASLWREGRRIGDKVEIIIHENDFSFIDIHSEKDLKLANLIIKNFEI